MSGIYSLSGKTVLVTGASSGIGRATAQLCAQLGASVVLNGRNIQALEDTLAGLEGEGHRILEADMASREAIDALVKECPAIDGLVCSAGVVSMAPFQLFPESEIDKIMDVNFFAPLLLVRGLVATKKFAKPASVVFVSSIDGTHRAQMGNSVYSASKGALASLSRSLALELARKKIRVNCVLPGPTDTPLVRTGAASEEGLATVAESIPLKRLASPGDIAAGIAYLLGDAASFVTGSELVIDGGASLT